MDYISIQELGKKTGVSGNTIIRYLKMFEVFFTEFKDFDGIKKYPEDSITLIQKIHALSSQRELTQDEIKDKIEQDFPSEAEEEHDPMAVPETIQALGSKIDKLTYTMDILNKNKIENLIKSINYLTEAITSKPAGQKKESVMDQLLTTKPDDPEDGSGLLDVFEKTEDIFSKLDTDKTLPVDDTDNTDDMIESNDIIHTDTLSLKPMEPDNSNKEGAGKEKYNTYIIDLIITLKESGLTLNEIKSELEKRRHKTFTGLDSWSTGTIGNLYNKHSGKKQSS